MIYYLTPSDAAILKFLVPGISGYLSLVLLHETLTRHDQVASVVALVAVGLVSKSIVAPPAFGDCDSRRPWSTFRELSIAST